MLRWLGDALASSIGKKLVMSLSGLLLIAYLVVHVSGNLPLFAGGETFDAYARKLRGYGVLLWIAEIGLALVFVAHIYLAFRLTLENREARRHRYAVRANRGEQTVASASMFVTGAIVLGFLIKHLLDFRFASEFNEAVADESRSPARVVAEVLRTPSGIAFYLVGSIAVGVHLRHAFRSACQTLGIHHPKLNPLLEGASLFLAVALALGYATFPIVFGLFRWGGVER